ncbi:Uncharacterised protein [Mycolicibacterium fortuitum]|uniref:Uncharacterized protein n=1 Tax=Mycolicibacterium fortuitum TaxID=1766 RepID=A0A378V0J0_MYCFO|nr:Uncharacterised protein [Mycolicibacterium fortuitum]
MVGTRGTKRSQTWAVVLSTAALWGLGCGSLVAGIQTGSTVVTVIAVVLLALAGLSLILGVRKLRQQQ